MTDRFFAEARPKRRLITLCMIIAAILQTLDATIANVALPHMQGALSATTDQISWVLTSYLIAAAIFTPAVGWLSTRFGRRRVFLVAMAGFTLASMLCGAAQTLSEMVGFRLLQGVFGAALVPLSQAVMLDIYTPEERGAAMSVWSQGIMLGPVIGPTLGAWLTDTYDWRYVFYVNLPIGAIGLFLLWAYLPKGEPDRSQRFDWLGFGALSCGIAGLQLMLDRGETKDWFDSGEIVLEAAVGAAGLWVFAVQMLTARRPFMTPVIFRDRNFMACLGVQFVIGIVLNATAALLPPYFQNLGDYPVLLSGIAMAPRGLGTVVASPIVARLIGRVDARVLMLSGLAVLAVSTWAMTTWTPDIPVSSQIPMVFLQGVTISLVFAPLQTVAFATLPAALRTECSGIINLMRNLGGSFGVAVMEMLLARNTQLAHAEISAQVTPFNRALQSGAPAAWWGTGNPHGAALLDRTVNYHAQIVAFTDDFLAMLFAMAPAAAMILLLRRPKGMAAPVVHEVVE